MAASTAQIAKLRAMVGNAVGGTPYTVEFLKGAIEACPTQDERGESPLIVSSAANPPARVVNPRWIPTYDLSAAAADVWDEKAALLSEQFDFKTDAGEAFSRSQAFQHAQERARHFRARRAPGTISAVKWPPEDRNDLTPWIGNLPEPEDDP